MNFARKLTALSALAFMAATSAACGIGASDDTVSPNVEFINHTKSAISAGGLLQINGTYGSSCEGHASGDPWSARLDGGDVTNKLSIAKGNTGCVLTLTELIDGDGTTDYDAAPSFALDTSYGTASAFNHSSALRFYGVAKLSAKTFAANFTMTLLISDEPNLAASDGLATGTFAQVTSSSVSASNVAPSDYSVDMTGFGVQVTYQNVVDSVSGSAALTAATTQGNQYAILSSSPGSSFASVDTAWTAVSSPSTISGSDPSIPASEFGLVSEDLSVAPAERWLVVRHEVDGVPSYQVIHFVFGKPGGYN